MYILILLQTRRKNGIHNHGLQQTEQIELDVLREKGNMLKILKTTKDHKRDQKLFDLTIRS